MHKWLPHWTATHTRSGKMPRSAGTSSAPSKVICGIAQEQPHRVMLAGK